jgi:hypothetical protein
VVVGERPEKSLWDTWAGPVTAIATGFAYGVGYASVSYFASILNASAADLGLDLRDYLLLTGLTALTWTLLVGALAATVWLQTRNRYEQGATWRKFGVGVASVLLPALVLAFVYQTVASRGHLDTFSSATTLIFVFVTYAVFFVGVTASVKLFNEGHSASIKRLMEKDSSSKSLVAEKGSPDKRLIGAVILLLVILAVTPSITLAGAKVWAESLLEDAQNGNYPNPGPFPLRLVLQPEVGSAAIEPDDGADAACVLRVGERVFLGREAVVVRDVTSFTSFTSSTTTTVPEPKEDADISSVPWSNTSGASTSC